MQVLVLEVSSFTCVKRNDDENRHECHGARSESDLIIHEEYAIGSGEQSISF